MITLFPYSDIELSFRCLCSKRAFTQVTHAAYLLNIMRDPSTNAAWQAHPAVKMWQGNKDFLAYYKNVGMAYCITRLKIKFVTIHYEPLIVHGRLKTPSWLGDSEFHMSHRAQLKRDAIADMRHGNSELLQKLIKIFGADYDSTPTNLQLIWPESREKTTTGSGQRSGTSEISHAPSG